MDRTIMIVEDHDEIRASLSEWLSIVFPEFKILATKSGEEAITQALAKPPDIVLMDIVLPRMSGIDATRMIKESSPKTKVVMLTLYDDDGFKAKSLGAGASAYVTKGRMRHELIPIIKELIAEM